jgi:glutamate synthase domain-containing protein 2
VLPSRYGMEPDQLRKADAIEVVVGRAPSPAAAACCSGRRSPSASRHAHAARGHRPALACRHPDWTGPDDLEIKIHELREITDWEKPIYVKVGAARPYYDTALAVKAGADVVVLDGMQGGTRRRRTCSSSMSAFRRWRRSARRAGADRSRHAPQGAAHRLRAASATAPMSRRALALGADAVSIGTAALIALGDNDPKHEAEYRKLGTTRWLLRRLARGPRPRRHHHAGSEADQTAQSGGGGRRLANYLAVMTLEAQTIARACRQVARAQS